MPDEQPTDITKSYKFKKSTPYQGFISCMFFVLIIILILHSHYCE